MTKTKINYSELDGLEEVKEVIAGEALVTLVYCQDTPANRRKLEKMGTDRNYYEEAGKLNITSKVWRNQKEEVQA